MAFLCGIFHRSLNLFFFSFNTCQEKDQASKLSSVSATIKAFHWNVTYNNWCICYVWEQMQVLQQLALIWHILCGKRWDSAQFRHLFKEALTPGIEDVGDIDNMIAKAGNWKLSCTYCLCSCQSCTPPSWLQMSIFVPEREDLVYNSTVAIYA